MGKGGGPPGWFSLVEAALEPVYWLRRCCGSVVGTDAFILLHQAVRSHFEDMTLRKDTSTATAEFEERIDMMVSQDTVFLAVSSLNCA